MKYLTWQHPEQLIVAQDVINNVKLKSCGIKVEMKFIFRTFFCGTGDCLFLVLKNGEDEMFIMVDCGKYTNEIDIFVRNELKNKIDYLIVTHIDNDHINGLVSMLSQNHDLVIGHIIYNCYQRNEDTVKTWTKKMKENVIRLYGQLPIVDDIMNQNINEQKAVTLAECILQNDEWKTVWQKEYVTDQSPVIQLANDMGRIVFLSPSMTALEQLDKKYRKLFWKCLFKQKMEDYNHEETIYEALMRIAQIDEEVVEEENVKDYTLNEETLRQHAASKLQKMNDNNIASIAFVWEHQGHRILFMGDADPIQVSNAIENVYKEEQKPIIFDLIKVSHHGSAHSTAHELMNVADSERFFFTGGSNKRPSIETLGRIITTPLPKGIEYREIRYNRQNGILNELSALTDDNKKQLHIKVRDNENSYEVSY